MKIAQDKPTCSAIVLSEEVQITETVPTCNEADVRYSSNIPADGSSSPKHSDGFIYMKYSPATTLEGSHLNQTHINLLNPTGHVMHQQFNI